jgi:acetate kinase
MMGTRSGSVDPTLIPFLMSKAGMSVEEVMAVLDKKSGLLGVSGVFPGMDGDVRISSDGLTLEAWVIHVEKGMQPAHECARI